ncbi:MAG TPA: hypothetical protein VMU22_07550 [Rhizomicrobium sp.]|nr:hypothetical protein [Rhizomicrobium sp.]
MAKFGFTDLHSFKDYVGFVKLCLPDRFPNREGVRPDDQWTLNLAFEGLRFGLDMAVREKGERREFTESRRLVDEAYDAYKFGDIRSGFMKLELVQKLLRNVPSQ